MNRKDRVIRDQYGERTTWKNHDLLDQCIKLRFELRYMGGRDFPQISKGHFVLGRDSLSNVVSTWPSSVDLLTLQLALKASFDLWSKV